MWKSCDGHSNKCENHMFWCNISLYNFYPEAYKKHVPLSQNHLTESKCSLETLLLLSPVLRNAGGPSPSGSCSVRAQIPPFPFFFVRTTQADILRAPESWHIAALPSHASLNGQTPWRKTHNWVWEGAPSLPSSLPEASAKNSEVVSAIFIKSK